MAPNSPVPQPRRSARILAATRRMRSPTPSSPSNHSSSSRSSPDIPQSQSSDDTTPEMQPSEGKRGKSKSLPPAMKTLRKILRPISSFIETLRSKRPARRISRAEYESGPIGKYDETITAIYSPLSHIVGEGRPFDLESVVELAELPVSQDSQCHIQLKDAFGRDEENPLTYISKSYTVPPGKTENDVEALIAELAAYTQLGPVQGQVVPGVLGVFRHDNQASIAMQLHDETIWVEASADMPLPLKRNCLAAYARLHAFGVLHGDPQLRHMLVNSLGQVWVVDFARSRLFRPDAASDEDRAAVDMERRKVEFLLDIDDARQREESKLVRCQQRDEENRRQLQGRRDGSIPPGSCSFIPDLDEDRAVVPVDLEVWNESWVPAATDGAPRRFIVPRVADAQLHKALESLERASELPNGTLAIQQHAAVHHSAEVALTPAVTNHSSSPNRYNLRKRQAADVIENEAPKAVKRARVLQDITKDDSTKRLAQAGADSPRSAKKARQSPGHSSVQRPPRINVEESTREDAARLPCEAPSHDPPEQRPTPKPPIARDYAYIPYDGPRGYVVHSKVVDRLLARKRMEYHALLFEYWARAAMFRTKRPLTGDHFETLEMPGAKRRRTDCGAVGGFSAAGVAPAARTSASPAVGGRALARPSASRHSSVRPLRQQTPGSGRGVSRRPSRLCLSITRQSSLTAHTAFGPDIPDDVQMKEVEELLRVDKEEERPAGWRSCVIA